MVGGALSLWGVRPGGGGLRWGAPFVVGAVVGSLNHLTRKFCFGAFFGRNKVLEMHLALFLDQLREASG